MLHLPKSVNSSQDICAESSNANVRIQANRAAADGATVKFGICQEQ